MEPEPIKLISYSSIPHLPERIQKSGSLSVGNKTRITHQIKNPLRRSREYIASAHFLEPLLCVIWMSKTTERWVYFCFHLNKSHGRYDRTENYPGYKLLWCVFHLSNSDSFWDTRYRKARKIYKCILIATIGRLFWKIYI